MRRAVVCAAALFMVFSVGVTSVSAASRKTGRKTAKARKNNVCRYVDKDGDGVCDNYASGQCRKKWNKKGYCGGGNRVKRKRICGASRR